MKNLAETKKQKYCESAIEMERQVRRVYFQLAERLYNIRQERLYEPYWDSWQEFCMEFKDLSSSSISKMISIYEVFGLKYGFSPEKMQDTSYTKIYLALAHIATKKDAEEWIKKSSQMTRQDLTKELVEAKTGVLMRECKHKDTFKITICRDCGDKWQEDEQKPKKKG